MAPEIADSDAESDLDLDLELREPTTHDEEAQHTHPSQISLSGFDFDQFLDSTQSHSSSIPPRTESINHPAGPAMVDGSSEITNKVPNTRAPKLFGEVSPGFKGKKRAHSALQGFSHDSQQDNSGRTPRSKRSKTYAAAARSHMTQEVDPFAPSTDVPLGRGRTGSVEPETRASDNTTPGLAKNIAMPDAQKSGKLSKPSSVASLPRTDSSHRMTRSTASMGQYESINLDFRGSGQGLDINTNPFGSLSQVSVDEDQNPPESETLADQPTFNQEQDGGGHESQPLGAMEDQATGYSESNNTANLPGQAPSSQTSRLSAAAKRADDSVAAQQSAGFGTRDDALETQEAMKTNDAARDSPGPKKRGRKPKDTKMPSRSPAPTFAGDADELGLPSPRQQRLSRREGADALSQASQTSIAEGANKKRKRVSAKTVVQEDQVPAEPAISSQVKHPTSELNLSDEAVIGIPKDAYNPRPSRSRSKKRPDEEAPAEATDSTQHNSTERHDDGVLNGEERETSATPAKPGGNKGRKSKVKRAKTSGGALLKKTEPMLDESDKDVWWVETKPTPVKLALPPDLKSLKNEPDDAKEDAAGLLRANVRQSPRGKEKKITVEIPNASEVKDSVAGPKKRGRKPKKAQPKSEEQVVEENEAEEDARSRPALAEKSPNLPTIAGTGATEDKSCEAGVAVTSPQVEADDLEAPASEEHNKQVTTPAKPKGAPSSPGKGPTRHSPINPPSLSGSGKKTLYRIGLSRRQHIPSLLRKVQRDKPPPRAVVRKEKKKAKDADADFDPDGEEGEHNGDRDLRGPDGMLIEWGD